MKAVLFDLYETLVTEYNPDRRREQRGARLGLAEDYFDREWGARHDQRMRGEFPDYHSVVRDICKAAKVKPNERVIEELYQERLEEKSFGFRQLDAGVVNMITRLRELGYLVAVVSNTTHDEVDSWTSCQLGQLIDDPIFSFAVGSMKPEPAIYLEALRRLDCVASEAVFVGDGGSSELAGARRVGLQPIWATWFLERWPSWRMSEVEPAAANCKRCREPSDLVRFIQEIGYVEGEDSKDDKA